MKGSDISILRHKTNELAVKSRIVLPHNMFTFLLEGEKTVHFAGSQVTLKPHQFVLLAAGNCLMTEKLAVGDAAYHSILLCFETKLLDDLLSRHAALLAGMERQPDHQPFLLFEKDEFLVNFIRSLDFMLQSGKPIPSEMQQVKLEELFLYLAIQYPGQVARIRSMSDETNDEDLAVRQAVTSHIDSSITVEELAFLCNMSLSSFKRRFARIYGNSPNKWLLEKRMERAARMLRKEKRKASEIYYELGYENLSSFIQSFKQIYGITPKQYQLSD
jgi:AraC family transcriptional regulator, exoenzyme S synthesis regulatory protein ExsA